MAKKKVVEKKDDYQSLLSRKCILIKMGVHMMNFWKKASVCEPVVKSEFKIKDGGKVKVHKLSMNKEYFDKIKKIQNKAISYFYMNTSKYPHLGWQLLPVVNHDKIMKALRGFKEEFEVAYDEMRDQIQTYKDTMKDLLGDLYNEYDYPSLSDMDRKFCFNIERSVVPNSGNLIADIAVDEFEEIRNEVETASEHALEVAMQSAWNKLIKVITRLRNRLMEPEKGSKRNPVIFDSLIGNIRELVNILPALNITENPDMHRIIQELERDITPLEVDDLKEDAEKRSEVARKADDILRSLQGIHRV